MNKNQREIYRKFRILRHAEETGPMAKTCRDLGVGKSSFYRWRAALKKHGEDGLINRPPIPKWHANRTPIEIKEKALYLRKKYHLGPMRIVRYLARYHSIQISNSFFWPASMPQSLAQNVIARSRIGIKFNRLLSSNNRFFMRSDQQLTNCVRQAGQQRSLIPENGSFG